MSFSNKITKTYILATQLYIFIYICVLVIPHLLLFIDNYHPHLLTYIDFNVLLQVSYLVYIDYPDSFSIYFTFILQVIFTQK